IPDNEMLESSAVHPSGDCYILTIDWEADIHTLYAVQNTWYPEWRTKWYEEHPDAADPFSNN
ncbi:MAG: hypothetical protein J5780_04780, partial [Treponema sp.]|nr:hypothetical protein [Treponema sp.]